MSHVAVFADHTETLQFTHRVCASINVQTTARILRQVSLVASNTSKARSKPCEQCTRPHAAPDCSTHAVLRASRQGAVHWYTSTPVHQYTSTNRWSLRLQCTCTMASGMSTENGMQRVSDMLCSPGSRASCAAVQNKQVTSAEHSDLRTFTLGCA